MPKISVIIPVYNAEKTVVRCVDSLLNQTLQDMEVIIIDDHGQDESIKIIQNHIAEHPRKNMFRFAETAVNSGPGEARNIGLQLAKGEYVAFVDSDDWVENEMYATLYETAIEHSAELCYSYVFFENFDESKRRISKTIPVPQGLLDDKTKRDFLENFRCHFWVYIYRRDFLSKFNIVFSPEKGVEDNYFLTCCVLCAERISYVNRPFYHYVYYPNSLSNRKNETLYLDKLTVFGRLFDFAKTHNLYENYRKELQFVYFKKAYLVATLNYLKNAKRPKIKVLREIYNELLNVCPDYNARKVIVSTFQLIATKLFRKL